MGIPNDIHLSQEAEDIIRQLLTTAESRLTAVDIKRHGFLNGVPWGSLRKINAPFVPQLSSITDTSCFPTDDLNLDDMDMSGVELNNPKKELAFVGYTFRRWETIRKDL